MSLSANLVKLRKKNDMTLQRLSEKSGVSIGYLSGLENETETNPSYKILKKLSTALNVEIVELIN